MNTDEKLEGGTSPQVGTGTVQSDRMGDGFEWVLNADGGSEGGEGDGCDEA